MSHWIARALPLAIISSMLIHIGLWGGLDLFEDVQRIQDDKVEVVILDPADSKNLKQIVEQQKAINDEIPKDAKFLSHSNQTVQKETRAAKVGKFNNNAGGGGSPQKTKTPKKQKVSDGTLPSLKKLVPQFSPKPLEAPNDVAQRPGPESQSDDHLKDVDKGIQTLLSTREFIYYSYYQRIRGKIRQFWEPSIREKVRKIFAQGRTIASSRDRITRVIIVLNRDGGLIKVQVIGKSGIRDLDDAAVDAFRAAEPFPNPPKGIVEPDGTIKIRWDFILEA